MRITIDFELNADEDRSEMRKNIDRELEDTLFNVIKESVEEIVKRSHCSTDYFKSCTVTKDE